MIKHFQNLSLFLLTMGVVVFSPGSTHAADAALDSMGSYFRVIWGCYLDQVDRNRGG